MTLRAVSPHQATAIPAGGYPVQTVSGRAPAVSGDVFALLNSAALGDRYGRPVFVSPPFVKSIETLILPKAPQHAFIPSGVLAADEGVSAFLGLNSVSYTSVESHDQLQAGLAALAHETSALLLFCPPFILSPELETMIQDLTEAGFMRDGVVQPLDTWQQGVAFVDKLVPVLPQGWDLIDACELLDFGPMEETKGINATLRCMGMRGLRKDDFTTVTRAGVLTHPINNRATAFIMMKEYKKKFPADHDDCAIDMPLTAKRLIVEFVFIASYLNSRVGLTRLAQENLKSIPEEILRQLEVAIQTLDYIMSGIDSSQHDTSQLTDYREKISVMKSNLVRVGRCRTVEDFVTQVSRVWNLT